MSRHLKSGTVEDMNDINKENILIFIGNVVRIYNKRGLNIETILLDPVEMANLVTKTSSRDDGLVDRLDISTDP